MVSIKDVARRAGVSISTVSSVINKNKPVSQELKEKVEKAINDLDYRPHLIARSLKSRKTSIIGVVLNNATSPFFGAILKGIEEVAYREGFNLMLCDSNNEAEREERNIQLLEYNWVDGIILDTIANPKKNELYFDYLENRIIKQRKIPIISIVKDFSVKRNESSVIIDNAEGGYLATKHLIDLGHKKIAHIIGNEDYIVSWKRLEGYKKALNENNIQVNESYILQGDFSAISGYNETKKLLLLDRSITAIFAANDQMAIGAIKALKEEGIRIPQDVAIVGYDNIFLSSLIDPSLSTINVPKYQIGRVAMELLSSQLKSGNHTRERKTLPINLIVRRSSSISGNYEWDLFGW
jgi:DNA-binding LacI/PurR family transcriptional regulator